MILELEREQNDLLIIAHESVLRVLYGYLMACDAMNIPTLKFPRNEIIEVSHLLWVLVQIANYTRSSPHRIKTRPSVSTSPIWHPISFPALLKISRSQYRPAASSVLSPAPAWQAPLSTSLACLRFSRDLFFQAPSIGWLCSVAR